MKARLYALDAMRGVAVFLMMEQHIGVWLWESFASPAQLKKYPVFVSFNGLGGGAAPLFISLAGMGVSLFAASRGASAAGVDATLVRRGVGVMAFGLLLNLLTPSWFSAGSWFVLHLMGLGILLGPLWRRLPTAALLTLAVLILATTAGVQEWLDTPRHLPNSRLRDTGMPGGVLRLALAEGQFPVLPWLALFLEGVVLGRWIAAERWRAGWILTGTSLALGAGLSLLFALGGDAFHEGLLWRLTRMDGTFYPCSPSYILLIGGLVTLVTWAVLARERRRGMSPQNPLVPLGRASLSLLLLHVLLFRELGRYVGLWSAFPAPQAFAGTLLAIGTFWLLTLLWQRVNYRFGAEWLLRKLAG